MGLKVVLPSKKGGVGGGGRVVDTVRYPDRIYCRFKQRLLRKNTVDIFPTKVTNLCQATQKKIVDE